MAFIFSNFTTIISALLVLVAAIFLFFFLNDYFGVREGTHKKSGAKYFIAGPIGLAVNFIDVLGVGSFAPATGLLKFFGQCQDRLLPGTLNAGFTIPVVYQAIVFVDTVQVEPLTMLAMMGAAVIGGYAGASVVSRLSEQMIRVAMGFALLITAACMAGDLVGVFPMGGTALGLAGASLAIGAGASFVLGALMTIGVGFYAPCMALVYSLGLDPRVAFPIMMSASAMMMPVASIRFFRAGAVDHACCFFMTAFGCLGVYLAIPYVATAEIELLKKAVLGFTVLTSLSMFYSFIRQIGRAKTV